MSTAPLTWVVGAGGLLGGAVVDACIASGTPLWAPPDPIRWSAPQTADQIASSARAFLAAASVAGLDWQVCWCAGAGVTSTAASALDDEARVFGALLAALTPAAGDTAGSLFLASSAGGVYAGSPGSPRDELTPPRPLAPYGHAKLALEQAAAQFADASGVPVLVGRLSNLYGPGQNLAKPQGLISHIARAHLLGQPISVYVPLDTMRDYLYVTDAARLVIDGMTRLRAPGHDSRGVTVKILASHQSVTVGFLVAEFRRVTRRKPRVVYGASSAAAYQAKDLRLRSVVWPELDSTPVVPLPVGMAQLVRGMEASLRAGDLR
ncbi:NAD-dependent epimerase/dehydratase family protein [Pimelobacter simplex]|uniref:NAD-dependent epimerase/dehydratase family protein n=1 Tax=Nocardioides simplex TaxID=2045 RepID=UPI001931D185|nr:NAD(P)-dependent oxidoreductase [Pimelobacter simplex]